MFIPINHPYMRGYRANQDNKDVEVVRLYPGQWTIFRAVDHKTVNFNLHPVSENMTWHEAMREARSFLNSKENFSCWDNVSDIGTR